MNSYGRRKITQSAILLIITVIIVILSVIFVCLGYDVAADIREFFGISYHIGEDEDLIRIIDVGQGDSILVHSNGRSVLIDTGMPDESEKLCKKLMSYGIKQIDTAILTHYHMDHAGGLRRIAEKFELNNLILPEIGEPQEGTDSALAAAEVVKGTSGGVFTAVQGMTVEVGEIELTVLLCAGDLDSENDRSLVIMARIDEVKFLLMSDAEQAAESVLLDEGLMLDCDVLKVAHHGSKTSTSQRFIDAVTPEYAVISCGEDNVYNHPHDETVTRLQDSGANVYRTDLIGDITFFVEDGKIRMETEK